MGTLIGRVMRPAPLHQTAGFPRDRCRRLAPFRKGEEAPTCWLTRTAQGKAAVLYVQYGCADTDAIVAGDRADCNYELWLLDAVRGRRLLADERSPLDPGVSGAVVAPSLDFAVIDARGHKVALERIDLSGAAPRVVGRFADGCMSPVLSPGAHWVVCRDVRGDVLRVPLAGGPAELVHRHRAFRPFYGRMPPYQPAVEFNSGAKMRVRTLSLDDHSDQTVAWQE
jgi:hypothetical protein